MKPLCHAVLHGDAQAVQRLLLAPLIEGTEQELQRRRRACDDARTALAAAKQAQAACGEAEHRARRARRAAQELHDTVAYELHEWEAAAAEAAAAASRPADVRAPEPEPEPDADARFSMADYYLAEYYPEPPLQLLYSGAGTEAVGAFVRESDRAKRQARLEAERRRRQEELAAFEESERERRRACRDSQTLSSDLAAHAAIAPPWWSGVGWEVLPDWENLTDGQVQWRKEWQELRSRPTGRIVDDPDAIAPKEPEPVAPWERVTKELLSEWARANTDRASSPRRLAWERHAVTERQRRTLLAAMQEHTEHSSPGAGALALLAPADAAADAAATGAAERERLSAQQRALLRAVFQRVDRNHDGALTRAEIILRLRKDDELAELLDLPRHVGDSERSAFEAVFQSMDADEDTKVDESEFVRFFASRRLNMATAVATEMLALDDRSLSESSLQSERSSERSDPDEDDMEPSSSLPQLFDELLALGQIDSEVRPAEQTQERVEFYISAVLDPLYAVQRNGWYSTQALVRLAQQRSAEALRRLEQAEQAEDSCADEAEELADDIAQMQDDLEAIVAEVGGLEARKESYHGPILEIRENLHGRVIAADAAYDWGPTAERGRLEVVDGNVRAAAPLPGASLALIAAWRGHLNVLQVLLALRADPDRSADDGSTPLFMAAGAGHTAVVRCLLDADADPAAVKHGGFSPLWNAAVNLVQPPDGSHPGMKTVHALLNHGQRRVTAARDSRAAVAQGLVEHLDVLTEASGHVTQRRQRAADIAAIREKLRVELEEIKATALADEEDSEDEEEEETQTALLENRASARRKMRAAAMVGRLSTQPQRGRRSRSPDPGESERRFAPKKTPKQIRARWRGSAMLASGEMKTADGRRERWRARSPDPLEISSDARWTAAAAASGRRHFRVWTCKTCGKRRIPTADKECPLCGSEQPPGPPPCPDFDDWVRKIDEESGDPYWINTRDAEKNPPSWAPPVGWQDEFYRRTSVKGQGPSKEAKELAKREENQAHRAQQHHAKPRPRVDSDQMAHVGALFAELDIDGDGSVSSVELAERLKRDSKLAEMLNIPAQADAIRDEAITRLFAAMDADSDGKITDEEFKTFFKSGKAGKAAIGMLDSQILAQKLPWVEEAEALLEEWVGVVDRDGSGTVDKKECKSMLRALAKFRAEATPQQAAEPEAEAEAEPEPGHDAAGEDAADELEAEPQKEQKRSPELFASLKAKRRERIHRKVVLQDMFAMADANGDGQITRAELIRSLRKHPKLAEMLDLPEKVGDEQRQAFERVFQAIDRDDNRTIDADEFTKFFLSGKAKAAAARLGIAANRRPDGAAMAAGEWEWEDLLEELDVDNDGQLSAKELMGLFVDVNQQDMNAYTTYVLKPLYELQKDAWYDPVQMTKKCVKELDKAEQAHGSAVEAMEKAERGCSAAKAAVQHGAEELAAADAAVSESIDYLARYLNLAASNGTTVLHVAADRGDVALLELLLGTDGLDINAQRGNGATALHSAASRGHVEVLQRLLAAGAATNLLDSRGRTAEVVALEACAQRQAKEATARAYQHCHSELIMARQQSS